MRRFFLSAAVLAALVSASFGLPTCASPDLVVSDATFSPRNPLAGSSVELIVTVSNVGKDDASAQFFVRIEVDGGYYANLTVNGGLPAGGEKELATEWLAEEGTHEIEIAIDEPLDRIAESNEANNVARYQIAVPSIDLRLAVGEFRDYSESGWSNVAAGVGDKLGQRLESAGVRTVRREELADTMQQEGLNPFSLSDAASGARRLGADVLLTGSVVDLTTVESSLSLGPIHLGYGTGEAELFVDLFDVLELQPVLSLSEKAYHEGATELSLGFEAFTSLPATTSVCAGGLSTDRELYHVGESVSIGYVGSGSAAWYGVEIHTTTDSFVRWLGWQYVENEACGRWFWDQKDSFGSQVEPGVYVAKVWDGTRHVATTNVQIQPGWSLFLRSDEIAVGSPGFEKSVLGVAVNKAVDRLVSEVVGALEDYVSSGAPAARCATLAEAPGASPLEGHVAAILPDGRIAINVGNLSDVTRGDFFEVIDPMSMARRGEVVIVEVRDTVSYAVPTSSFSVEIGDLARRVEP
jgi:hypothetical protein